jgi:chromosome segregation ATPase
MDKLKSLQTDLKTAQDALTALQDELPQFHALLTDNEGDAQRLKSERASLDAQAQARGRVGVAKEMLEQHQSDVANACAEVTRCETAVKRESALAEMFKQAELTQKHRDDIDTQLQKASKTLEGYAQRCIEAYDSLTAAFHAYRGPLTLTTTLNGVSASLVASLQTI